MKTVLNFHGQMMNPE